MKKKRTRICYFITKPFVLLLLFGVYLNFMGCHNNAEPVLHADKDTLSAGPINDQGSGAELKSMLEQKLNCTVLYLTKVASDSTFTAVYVSPRDAKSNHFFSDTLTEIYAAHYKLHKDELTAIKSKKLHDVSWTYLELDTTSYQALNIDARPYFYFSDRESYMGKAVLEENVIFHLVSLSDLFDYQLVYTGKHGFQCEDCIIGDFAAGKALAANRRLYDLLMGLADKSNLIYHKGEQDKDPYSWLNYETKWNKDNQTDYSFGAGHGDITTPVKTTYYKTDLFALNQGSVTDSIANEDYIVVSYFRSNLIGYDKKKKYYFPILVESCNYSCAKTLRFIDANRIAIQYEDEGEEPLELSLGKDLIFDAVIGK
jgi:hypothetical protein